jgi:hypothetical protein
MIGVARRAETLSGLAARLRMWLSSDLLLWRSLRTASSLTCPTASRRRTAPYSCGAAGCDALNALGHFVTVDQPATYT